MLFSNYWEAIIVHYTWLMKCKISFIEWEVPNHVREYSSANHVDTPPKKGYIIHGIATIMGECVDFFYRFLQGMTTGLPATGCDLCNHKKPKILNPKLVSQFFQHTILMASNVQWFIGSAISRSGWWRKGPDRSPQESPWFWRWCPLIFFSRVGNIFNYNFNHYPLVN